VRASGTFTVGLLLQAQRGVRLRRIEPNADETHRRAVYPDPLLRGAKDEGLAKTAGIHRKPQTGKASHAKDGSLCHLSKETAQQAFQGA